MCLFRLFQSVLYYDQIYNLLFVFQRQSWQKYHEHKKDIKAAVKIEHDEKVHRKTTFKKVTLQKL